MKKRIAINGFGRIGRGAFKNIIENYGDELEIVAVNDLLENEKIAYLLKHDSVYGTFGKSVELIGDELKIEGLSSVKLLAQKNPDDLPWKELEVDVVLECTGLFVDYENASKHLGAGAKKVIISAPSKDPDKIKSFVLGVNEEEYDSNIHHVVDMGSCTTNCLAPIVKIINDNFGILSGMMTTIHSYTISQNLLDGAHKDFRRSRAAAINIIPTTTGATKAVGRVIPEVEGKINGIAMRVPTATVSIIDLVCNLKKEVSKEEALLLLKEESGKEKLRKILKVEDEELVSTDYVGSTYSSIVDAGMTHTNGSMLKVLSWYDNEWGYSARLADFAAYIGNA